MRMKTAGVCHSDLHVIKGDLAMPMPVIRGHEGAGVIESVGEGVASVPPGDRVIRSGGPRLCLKNSTGRGG